LYGCRQTLKPLTAGTFPVAGHFWSLLVTAVSTNKNLCQ